MPGFSDTLTLDQLEAQAKAKGVELATLNMAKPLQAAAAALRSDFRENFDGSHGPDGTPWPGLKHPRIRSKGADKPLLDRGLLAASAAARGTNHIENVTPNSLEIGTNDERAALHQFGGEIRPKKGRALSIPLTVDALRAGGARNFPRPLFVDVTNGDKAFLAETVQKGRGKKRRDQLIRHYILVPKVTIPARPFIGFSEKVLGIIDTIFADFLQEHAL